MPVEHIAERAITLEANGVAMTVGVLVGDVAAIRGTMRQLAAVIAG